MQRFKIAFSRIKGLFGKRQLDAELDAELRFHLEMEAEENLRKGMSTEEAKRQARLRLGGVEQVKEEYRDLRAIPFLESVHQDLRLAIRILRRRPGTAGTAILTLGLGIGVTTALFSALNQVLLEPLPVDQPERQVILWGDGTVNAGVSPVSFHQWRTQNHSFHDLAAVSGSPQPVRFMSGEQPFFGNLVPATHNLFRLYGYRPLLGRGFRPDDEELGAPLVAMLSRRAWISYFGGARDIIGKEVRLDFVERAELGLGAQEDGGHYTILGVAPDLPASLVGFGVDVDFWAPHRSSPAAQSTHLLVYGKLRPGVDLEQARAEMESIASGIPEEAALGRGVRPQLLTDFVLGSARSSLLLLFGAASLLLLAACANIATLQLANANRRRPEFCVRISLGAGRRRLIRQLLTESCLLSLCGGLAGCLFAWWTLQLFEALGPGWWRDDWEIGFSYTSLAFSLAVSGVAAMLAGLAPALATVNADVHRSVRVAGPGSLSRQDGALGLGLLTAAQTAAALVLLVGALLLIQSAAEADKQVARGLSMDRVHYFQLQLPLIDSNRSAFIFREVLERTESLPGVVSAGLTQSIPPVTRYRSAFRAEGELLPLAPQRPKPALRNNVSEGYFRTLGISLVRGRMLGERDRRVTPVPVLINEAMANARWEGRDPIGAHIYIGRSTESPFEVVGVVSDATNWALAGARPEVYFHYSRQRNSTIYLVLRSTMSADAISAAIREVVRSVDSDVPIEEVGALEDHFAELMRPRTFTTIQLAAFASFAVVLASIGIWGMVGHGVSARTQEIGLRLALGATPTRVSAEAMRKTLTWSLMGLLAGFVGALGSTRLIASELYGVSPTDKATLFWTSVLLLLVTLSAGYLPARRAARIDPLIALRHD